MNLSKAVLLTVFTVVLIGQASLCLAQAGRAVGGFREADKTDKMVVGAANFAVKTKAREDASLKLISILRAERQIVAGSNYQLCLAVASNGGREQAKATVFLSLQNVYSLKNWTIENCAEDNENANSENGEDELVTYQGTLQLGKTGSAIVYVGEESGDVAAFCFTNNSEVGRAIMAACRNGGQCEFTGKVDGEAACKIKDERDLSASGRITSVKSVKRIAPKKASPARRRGN
ncbi:MAG TPA: cystatin domain-containing protein [Pyrinomonadaceae bacterium]|nr:cystatin domain-containing protein [Pyrinomonadaceae bacterium]